MKVQIYGFFSFYLLFLCVNSLLDCINNFTEELLQKQYSLDFYEMTFPVISS